MCQNDMVEQADEPKLNKMECGAYSAATRHEKLQ